MAAPTVSIIVPVYNVEKYLHRCINSLLAQTHDGFEIIIVDDGSTDGSGQICDSYAEQDARIRVIHQANRGLSAARNAGIDSACASPTSEYITFVDSDDWVTPDYLSELLHGITLSDGVSCTSCALTDEFGNRQVRYPDRGWMIFPPEEYWLQYSLLTVISCGKLFKKRLFSNIRFPEGKIHEDVFTTHQLLFPCKRIAFRQKATYNYFVRSTSITKSKWSPRRLDALAAYRAQCNYFLGRFPRAYQKAHAALLGLIIEERDHIQQYLPNDAETYRKILADALQNDKLPFWPYRGFFRAAGQPLFWPRWAMGMLGNAITYRRESWLCVESIPIARELIRRAFKQYVEPRAFAAARAARKLHRRQTE